MKVIINNKINGFFIITPHFNDDGKIKCVYNKFNKFRDDNISLECPINENVYHIHKIINRNEFVLYTYNNNLIITCEKQDYEDNYHINIYYYYDPDVHSKIYLPNKNEKFEVCKRYIANKYIEGIINYIYFLIYAEMYHGNQFLGHEKELLETITNMFYKIGIINYDDAGNIISRDDYDNKFDRNN